MTRNSSASKQFLKMHQVELNEWAPPVSVALLVVLVFVVAMINYRISYMNYSYDTTKDTLTEAMQNVAPIIESINGDEILEIADIEEDAFEENQGHVITMPQAPMTAKMGEVYALNSDCIGWLKIDGMVIDYPVMQTMADEQYYLNRDFEGNYSAYGCLLADTDSTIGSGTRANNCADGTLPSTNIIIHGHNMKNGTMFGDLDKYRDKSFEEEHNIIKFSSLYEEREYEICSVFLSQVYKKTDECFKYYKFFQADTEEEFKDFYDNIKKLQLYDTGVTAEFGDEFITLSVCAYHVENGRLVVVGKRIK